MSGNTASASCWGTPLPDFQYKHVAGWVLARQVKSPEVELSLSGVGRVVLLVVDYRVVGWSERFTLGEPVDYEALILR